jgi:hypothetical protein
VRASDLSSYSGLVRGRLNLTTERFGSPLENKPCEEYRVSEDGERPNCSDGIAGRVARVHKPDAKEPR